MIVREAHPGEMTAVGELRVAAYEAEGLLTAHPAYAGMLRALGTNGHGEVLVAVEDDQILGTAMMDPYHPGSELATGPKEAEMRALAVDPNAQGRGVGATLIRAVLDRAAARGATSLLLSTQPAMKTAQRLYLAQGFTRLPNRDWAPIPGFTLLAFGRTLNGTTPPPG
ncbi:GNAT family N-acetyltransferase [Sphaerisporangium aureirubrum]|uniref:GNAT family N-acetyltransferase n=1 Tax=Sphaerisporangium aureirubrum TaxID=1544736 RepID=A0ABW1NJL7_9ACTN